MNFGKGFTLASAFINIIIFIYFIRVLYSINSLDMFGLLISAFGILVSLIANIVSALEI